MHDTGCLGLVHWEDPEGWYGEGGGGGLSPRSEALRQDPAWCMCEEGLVKDPESRAERDSEERKR